MGGPYLFFLFSPSVAFQIIINNIPIIVSSINCHQPYLLISCSLLVVTAIPGKIRATVNNKFIGP